MSFELDTTGATQQSSGGGKDIDFDGMNAHVIEVVGTQSKAKTVVGFVSGMYDLGMQPRPDFEKIHDPSKQEEVEAVAKGEATLETKDFYDEGKLNKNVVVFSKPRTPAKAFALSVDFPQFQCDKGQFFGESKPLPLRLLMGGTWTVNNPDKEGKKMPIINSPFYLAENTNNDAGIWAISNRTTLHKMAEAADILNDQGLLVKEDVSKLLGKALMFKVRVYQKENKGKQYYTEEIKFVSEVPEGLPIPEFDESLIHGVNMNRANVPEYLQQTRAVVKNTMRLSLDWDSSVVKGEIAAMYQSRKPQESTGSSQSDDSSNQGGSASEGDKSSPAEAQEGSVGNNDKEQEDIPF